MRFSIFPKETNFFDMFDKLAAIAVEASNYFYEIASKAIYNEDSVSKMQEIEHRADEVTHEIIDSLNKTFITPFDREDIFELIHATDSVLDLMYGAAKQTHLYKLREIPNEFREMADTIRKASIEINTAFNGLRDVLNLSKYKDNCHKIGELEEHADDINHRYLAMLFEEEKDAIELIKKKDILAALEKAVDRCDDVADILSSVIIKIA